MLVLMVDAKAFFVAGEFAMVCIRDSRRQQLIAGRAGKAAPELRMAIVAVMARDVSLLHHILPEMLAVYGAIFRGTRGTRPVKVIWLLPVRSHGAP